MPYTQALISLLYIVSDWLFVYESTSCTEHLQLYNVPIHTAVEYIIYIILYRRTITNRER